MFPNSQNQFILLLDQSPPAIITLQPQSTPVIPLAQVLWNGTNNANWTFVDQSGAPGLLPSGLTQLWTASGNTTGSAEGSAVYEIYSAALTDGGPLPFVNKLDISNVVSGAQSTSSWLKQANGVDATSSPRVVRLLGNVSTGVNVAAVGKCSTAGTCLAFFADSGFGVQVPQTSPTYDPTGCVTSTSGSTNLIIMVTTSGVFTFNYGAANLQTTPWVNVSKSTLPSAVLSCGVSGSKLYAVLQGGSMPAIRTASMSATSWEWQTATLVQPVVQASPSPPATGSSGDSGGAPGSGGSNGSNGSSTNPNDSSSGSKTGKGVIIAIAIVAALLLILIPILILWWCRRKRQNDKKYEERTKELKKSIVMDQDGGKRMCSSLPLPRAIPRAPQHSPVTFYLETPGATPALGGMTLIGHDRSSHSGSSSMPGSSTMSYDERLSVHPSHPSMQSLPSIQSPTMQSPLQMQAQPSIQSLLHPYQQPSRTWSQDGGSVANDGSPSPRTLNPS
ncbi:hypothetical protein EMPS_06531 [Entomortierella parvispora]|uniref:Uncharacterized protein n=1 Tax=Entomortierella parvispora TaxID=205924 RepID=A0A9P3HCX0_9FUNG|nr:hypothetical protein EMPS_06531 [Entomortierella parvispora]